MVIFISTACASDGNTDDIGERWGGINCSSSFLVVVLASIISEQILVYQNEVKSINIGATGDGGDERDGSVGGRR